MMRTTVEISSHAQPGTVFLEVVGPFYDRESDVCSVRLELIIRDRMNDKVEVAAGALIEAEAALMLSDVLKSVATAAIEMKVRHAA